MSIHCVDPYVKTAFDSAFSFETIEAVDLFAKVDRKGLLIRTPVSILKERRKNAKPTMVLKN
jgi:hypothetical protein